MEPTTVSVPDARPAGLLRRIGGKIGPGVITAAVVLGPGSVTTSSKSGALMGCSILWVLVMAGIMMVAFTYLGAKIGMLSKESFLTTTAAQYGRSVSVLVGLSAFFICVGFQTGDNVGVGIALGAMFGGSMQMWAIVFTVLSLIFLWGSSRVYQALEKMMVVLVLVMIASFLLNLLRIHPSGTAILSGLVPGKPKIFGLVIAISATSFSVAAAAFQPYLVRSKGWTAGDVRKGLTDSAFGIFLLVGISAVIMITSATVLQPRGIKVNNAVDMAMQLEPLLGTWAKWLFLSGLWAAAFSSFIVNAMVGGTLLADGLGIGKSLDSFWSKLFASFVMVLGTVAALIAGKNPIELLILAQATTILGVPLIAAVMWLLTMDRTIMRHYCNSFAVNLLIGLSLVWLVYLSVRQAMVFAGVIPS